MAVYVIVTLYARKSLRAIKAAHADSKQKGTAKRFLTDRNVWFAVLGVLMFGGYQSGMLVWVSHYF